MADVKWFKIYTNMFDNKKMKQIDSLPERDAIIVIWYKLLCLAADNNADGYIYFTEDIPYTDDMLSTAFNRNVNIIKLAMSTFEKFKMIEIKDELIKVKNWEKYQNVDKLTELREYNRIKQQEHRARIKENNNVNDKSMTSQPSQALDIDKEEEKEIDKDIKKKNTKKNFSSVVNEYTTNETLKNTLLDFYSMRLKIKKPITDLATTKLLNKLDRLASTDNLKIKVVEQSIIHCWQDFYELKEDDEEEYNPALVMEELDNLTEEEKKRIKKYNVNDGWDEL